MLKLYSAQLALELCTTAIAIWGSFCAVGDGRQGFLQGDVYCHHTTPLHIRFPPADPGLPRNTLFNLLVLCPPYFLVVTRFTWVFLFRCSYPVHSVARSSCPFIQSPTSASFSFISPRLTFPLVHGWPHMTIAVSTYSTIFVLLAQCLSHCLPSYCPSDLASSTCIL